MVGQPGHPGLYLEVRGWSGWGLNEFPDEEATKTTGAITTYIHVRDDMEFEIGYKFYRPFPCNRDVSVTVSIDGIVMRKVVVRRKDLQRGDPGLIEGAYHKQKDGSWVVQRFRFNRVISTTAQDDDETKSSSERGSIKIELHFGKAGHEPKEPWGRPLQEPQSVSETKTKGQEIMSIQVGPGLTSKKDMPLFYKFERDGGPFATFVFKYRYRDELEDLGIIPRSRFRPVLAGSPDTKPASHVKTEPHIENGSKVKSEPDTSAALEADSGPEIKIEPGINGIAAPVSDPAHQDSISQHGRDAKARKRSETEPRIKQEPEAEEDVASPPLADMPQNEQATGTRTASAALESSVPAKRELNDADEDMVPEKKLKQEEKDETTVIDP